MKQKYLLLVILKYPIHTLNSSVLSAPMTRTCALRAPPIKISKFLDLGEPNLLCEKVYITHLRTGITMLYSYNVHVLGQHLRLDEEGRRRWARWDMGAQAGSTWSEGAQGATSACACGCPQNIFYTR